VIALAYASTLVVLGTYGLSVWRSKPGWFDAANAVCWGPLTAANLSVGAVWGAVISATFGIIGTVSLLRDL
jgi:hypothetical protein